MPSISNYCRVLFLHCYYNINLSETITETLIPCLHIHRPTSWELKETLEAEQLDTSCCERFIEMITDVGTHDYDTVAVNEAEVYKDPQHPSTG